MIFTPALLAQWFLWGLLAFLLQGAYMYAMARLFPRAHWVRVAFYAPIVLVMGAGLYYTMQYFFIVDLFRAIK